MKISAIVTAGGSGKRFGGNIKKQYKELCNRPVIFRSIDPLYNYKDVNCIVVVVPAEDLSEISPYLKAEFDKKMIRVVPGGSTRQKSVLAGLRACPPDTEAVFIHDGVRPLYTEKNLDELIVMYNSVDAAILAAKVKNTIKEYDGMLIEKTLNRDMLIKVFTPQIFSYNIIKKLHEVAEKQKKDFTDDAGLLEHYGMPVGVVEQQDINLKITCAEDLEIATLLWNKYFK